MEDFLKIHRDQLVSSGVPEYLWRSLYIKLMNKTFDVSAVFNLLKIEYDGDEEDIIQSKFILRAIRSIKTTESEHIYLIDHAWSCRINEARSILLFYEALRKRLCNIFDFDPNEEPYALVDKLFKHMWKINNYYCIRNSESDIGDILPIWYVMDEVGTGVTHSNEPNCKIVPFWYENDQTSYSILFPIRDIEEEETITRDFAEGEQDPDRRDALLLPWAYKSFEDFSIIPPQPPIEYFYQGRIEESLPNLLNLQNQTNSTDILKVYSQYSKIKSHLSNNRFRIVEEEDEADILWYIEHFIDFNTFSYSPNKFINQFPFEYILTVKDLFCVTCRNKNWYPTTYNLVTELPNFVSYFQKRESEGEENYWIVKPFNLARSLDIHITDNLDYIVRVSLTCPKIAQRYITNPVLFYRPECEGNVKFDIRYVVLLKSVEPLQCYVYKNFFLRFANKLFELNDFDDYEKHFTVMNYVDDVELKHMQCTDFILNWDVQYPEHNWDKVEEMIYQTLKEMFECGIAQKPPCGIAHSPQSRALYAVDLMLEWNGDGDMEPKILEVNFAPDCARACDYYPDFFNDIFSVLFLNQNCLNVLPL